MTKASLTKIKKLLMLSEIYADDGAIITAAKLAEEALVALYAERSRREKIGLVPSRGVKLHRQMVLTSADGTTEVVDGPDNPFEPDLRVLKAIGVTNIKFFQATNEIASISLEEV